MTKPAAPDPLLTAADVARLLGISRTSAYELLGRIPFHVRIGLGKRQQLRLPRSAFDRWLKAGGDKCPSSGSSPTPRTGTPRDATALAGDGAAAPSRLRVMPPLESHGASKLKELFPGYDPSRSKRRSRRSLSTRRENE